jgi:Holliday junction DNA helicase RuvB
MAKRSGNRHWLRYINSIARGIGSVVVSALARGISRVSLVWKRFRITQNRRDATKSRPNILRPRQLAEFIGQEKTCANLEIFINAARHRGEPLEPVLLVGPSGCGKTTLARMIATELGAHLHATCGPAIVKANDLIEPLEEASKYGDVFFLDEIHQVRRGLQELLYEPMEAGSCTVIGATTRAGLITKPLRDRFGIIIQLSHYGRPELEAIVNRSAQLLGIAITPEAIGEIARRARGTPRIAMRLLRRARDLATSNNKHIDYELVDRTLDALEIDSAGLNRLDQNYLHLIGESYGGGPVGLEVLAAALSESPDTIEDVVEPYLQEIDFVRRTSRGRILGAAGFRHLGIPEPRWSTASDFALSHGRPQGNN